MDARRPPLFPFYELHVSLRYLRSRFSALAALLSVTFGVGVIVIVLSIMGGYMEVLRASIRGQESHLMVLGPRAFSITGVTQIEEVLSSQENVKATAPFVESLAMFRGGNLSPCHLKGILPGPQAAISDLGRYVLRPAELDRILAELEPESPAGEGVAEPKLGRPIQRIDEILGAPDRKPLGADELEAFFDKDFGRRLLEERNPRALTALHGRVPPAVVVGIHFLLERQMSLGQVVPIGTVKPGSQEPVEALFLVAGAFRTGDYDSDSRAIHVHLDVLKNVMDLFDPGTSSYRYEGIRVALKDPSKLNDTRDEIRLALREKYPWLRVLTWEQLRSNLLQAVQIEKILIYIILVLLMGFTGCLVLLMLILTVIEKTRDIGILLALGATPAGIIRIFLSSGILLSAAGTVLGLAFGYLFCAYINPLHDWIHAVTGKELFPAQIYHMDRIPILFQPADVLLSIAPPVILGFLSSLVPAIWASRRDPIKAIHYE